MRSLKLKNKPQKKEWGEEFYKQLGNFLRKKRLEYNINNDKDLNCKELQKTLLGVGTHCMNDYESGRTKISLFDFLVLLGFYNNTVEHCDYTVLLKTGIENTIKENGISPNLIYKFIKKFNL